MLVLPPLVIASLLILGIWSTFKANEMIHRTADHYLQNTLDTYVTQDLARRYQILKKNGMDQVPSFVRLYQKEAADAAATVDLVWPGHIFVFDKAGKLVFDSQKQEATVLEAKWAPAIKRLLAAKSPNIQGHVEDEFFRAISFAPWDWLVFVAFSDQPVHQASQRIQIVALVIALASAALMIGVLGLLFRRFVAKPISTLRLAATDIASQNYPESVGVHTQDELGSLARDMEKMAGEIKESQQKVLGFTNELESMVEERTEKIEKSQAGLARAQKIARLGSWEWNVQTNDLIWSDEVFRIFGLKPGELEPTYEAFFSFVHPQDREMVKETVNEAVSRQKTYSAEHRIVRPDRSIRVVSELGELSLGPDGHPLQLVGTVHDITERKIAEEERLNREKLQGAIETAGAVCHELSQPLQAIMLHIELACHETEYQGISARAKAMLQEVENMAETTAKLQRITKYETQDYMEETKILDLDKSST